MQYFDIQYRHLIPAPVGRTSARAWLYKLPYITCRNNTPSTPMTQVAWECYIQLWSDPWIHAQEIGWQSGVRSCIMSGHLMQELNADTVLFAILQQLFSVSSCRVPVEGCRKVAISSTQPGHCCCKSSEEGFDYQRIGNGSTTSVLPWWMCRGPRKSSPACPPLIIIMTRGTKLGSGS